MTVLISYCAAIDGALLGLWLAAKWPAPRWEQFAAVGEIFVGMNLVMQMLIG